MTTNSVSQKWLIGILTTIVLAGGAGWMTYVQSQLSVFADEQKKQKVESASAVAGAVRDTAVIKEKVERLEKDVNEIKQDQREMTKGINELLRRVR